MKTKTLLQNSKKACLLVVVLAITASCYSQLPCHDPSSIIKCGSKYYIFGTGSGIAMASSSSSSFSTYTIETSPFASGDPSWISSYVSSFGGVYWAPECIYMNSKYYLYYSVSMGAKPCAIGVVTTPSLTSPTWTDQGMVVYSNTSTSYGSIDPDVFFDQSGYLWLAYGSHLNGIVLAQLSTSTGKPLNTTRYNIVSSTDAEAAHLEYHNGYYYIFYNRYTCCAGLESNYTIFMGRATSITGPYYDKDGVSCASGGGSVFLQTDGRYIGPGHFGYGESKLTYHFYDGNDYGASKLMVSTLSWSNDWPVAATNTSGGSSITAGTYTITNRYSSKVLDVTNCSTTDGANVEQWASLSNTCQQWVIASAGSGFYTIQNVNSGMMLDAVNCGFFSGTNVDQWTNLSNTCQQWSFISTGSYYRIVNRNSGKDLEVANASTDNGANVQIYGNNGSYCQNWSLTKLKSATINTENNISVTDSSDNTDISIYPNPVSTTLNINGASDYSNYTIYSINGTVVKQGILRSSAIDVEKLAKGMYCVYIDSGDKKAHLKFIKE
jgi:arabinan endo-1,5-alpha-L-arabinosidase